MSDNATAMEELACTFVQHDHGERIWACVGRAGAVHISIRPSTLRRSDGEDAFIGGLEVHSRKPFSYSDPEPDHNDCWLLKGPCWHDGTSLYVSEVVIPFWLVDPENNERMFKFLKRDYETRFSAEAA